MPIRRGSEWTESDSDNGIWPSNEDEWDPPRGWFAKKLTFTEKGRTQTYSVWFHFCKVLETDTLPLVTLGEVVTRRGHSGSVWGTGMLFLCVGLVTRCAHLWRFIKLLRMTCAFFCRHAALEWKVQIEIGDLGSWGKLENQVSRSAGRVPQIIPQAWVR